FFGFLRSEVKFEGLEALIVQMKRDEEEARALLASVQPLSRLDAAIAF
ncbi:bifunctional riboflavin kinase/FAD synthetase, partial [Actinomadura sp. DSM 109109]|nr:bifunctional riboflavin kinase/FAD synthetase [Actinomadura lepetitiana]